ncbi:MAG: adenosylmethionine decarboxylase [Candidatus Aminicenantia bacterium]
MEMFGCDPEMLKDKEMIEKFMNESAVKSKAKVVKSFFHQFKPYGVSGVVVIEESHYTIHTWPEHSYAAIDFFYCSDEVEIEKAIEVLKQVLKPSTFNIVEIKRGVFYSSASDSKSIKGVAPMVERI